MQTIPAFYFDPATLAPIAERQRAAFQQAQPFQHVVLDEFLPREVLDLLIAEFPGPDDPAWQLHGPGRTAWQRDRNSAKLGTSDETRFGPFTRHFMAQLNSATFLAFLERLTGVQGILPDVTYSHCGMHSTGRGGRLMMHTDVNRHPQGNHFHQYLNLILYLNRDWREEYGGHLELWDQQRRPVHRILPQANRVVLFNAGTRSLHGHPHPLTCPEDRRRNSLAVYYYLRERPHTDEYEGQQKFVHWVAATDEDRAYGRERTAQALARIDAIRGRAIDVPLPLIPFDVPAALANPTGGTAPLWFLRREEFADAAAFCKRHLREVVAGRGTTPARFLAEFEPIALLGARTQQDLARSDLVAALMDRDGEVHVVRGPDSHELFWVGYLDEILASIVA